VNVKVLTYNIHGWRSPDPAGAFNLDALVEVIGDAQADLVGLNEVFHPRPADSGPALAHLAARLGMAFAFGPTLTAAESPTGIPYGNAVLSRWQLVAHAAHRLAAGPADATCEPRGLFEARLLSPAGQPFTLYVLHLDHRSEAIRLAQWRAASAWLGRDRGRPHLLVGDFNALAACDFPTADAVAELQAWRATQGWPAAVFDLVGQIEKAGYRDAFSAAGASAGATFPAAAPHMRIDYIFVPSGAPGTLVRCRRWDHPRAPVASDHLPMLAEFA
jgi:endonuclease/exonuclease/phosphatase family metal-dependent hydrolase